VENFETTCLTLARYHGFISGAWSVITVARDRQTFGLVLTIVGFMTAVLYSGSRLACSGKNSQRRSYG
jgi:hypothetical protein